MKRGEGRVELEDNEEGLGKIDLSEKSVENLMDELQLPNSIDLVKTTIEDSQIVTEMGTC